MGARLRAAVLISGRGSNLGALVDAARDPAFPAEIALAVSNVPDAPGLAHAAGAGIAAATIDHRRYADRARFEDAVHERLAAAGAELVCLAGFMRLLTAGFVDRWAGRMINIHPSLLPAYRGLRCHERVLADGARVTGCTVHFVSAGMDEGPIILQAAVPVLDGDDAAALAGRVLAAEHRCYPLAVRLIAEDRVRVRDGRVRVDWGVDGDAVLFSSRPAPERGGGSGS